MADSITVSVPSRPAGTLRAEDGSLWQLCNLGRIEVDADNNITRIACTLAPA